MTFETLRAADALEVTAPDGSRVRVLPQVAGGSMALFELAPGRTSTPVAHRTVEELWYVIGGQGEMWRSLDGHEEIVELEPGVALTIPVGAHFQFRSTGAEPLIAAGATMPPWPGEDEAYVVPGPWTPDV